MCEEIKKKNHKKTTQQNGVGEMAHEIAHVG